MSARRPPPWADNRCPGPGACPPAEGPPCSHTNRPPARHTPAGPLSMVYTEVLAIVPFPDRKLGLCSDFPAGRPRPSPPGSSAACPPAPAQGWGPGPWSAGRCIWARRPARSSHTPSGTGESGHSSPTGPRSPLPPRLALSGKPRPARPARGYPEILPWTWHPPAPPASGPPAPGPRSKSSPVCNSNRKYSGTAPGRSPRRAEAPGERQSPYPPRTPPDRWSGRCPRRGYPLCPEGGWQPSRPGRRTGPPPAP